MTPQRALFADSLRDELDQRMPKPKPPEYCANCPFAKLAHWEENGKLVSPSCDGFEPMP
jgi:hypothetical protein